MQLIIMSVKTLRHLESLQLDLFSSEYILKFFDLSLRVVQIDWFRKVSSV